MNIFRILSASDGRDSNQSVSSFLAYLLNPQNDHGLGEELLRSIVADFCECGNSGFMNLDKELSTYEISVNIDLPIIVVKFIREGRTKFVLCIENEVKDSSIDSVKTQMKLDGLENEFVEENPKILFCFLTLKPSRKSAEDFEKIRRKHPSSIHLFWIPSDHKYKSIYEKLQKILTLSNEGCIDPITSEVRYLLTSFLNFIKKGFKDEEELHSRKH